MSQSLLIWYRHADRMEHVANEPRADWSRLGSGERNSASPKALECPVSGRDESIGGDSG